MTMLQNNTIILRNPGGEECKWMSQQPSPHFVPEAIICALLGLQKIEMFLILVGQSRCTMDLNDANRTRLTDTGVC